MPGGPGALPAGEALLPPLRRPLVRRAVEGRLRSAPPLSRSRIGREAPHGRAYQPFQMPTPTTRATSRTMACGPVSGSSLLQSFLTSPPRSPDLADDKAQPRPYRDCSSAETFGGAAGVLAPGCVALQDALRRLGANCGFEVADAQPSQGWHFIRVDNRACVPRPGTRRSRFGRLASPLRQSSGRATCCNGPVPHGATPRTPASASRRVRGRSGFCPAMVPAILRHSRDGYTLRLDPTRNSFTTCQPKTPSRPASEGKRNPRDLFTGPDCLIAPAMQQAKQPFGTRLQLLARLTLNAGKHPGNQPARLAHLDDGNDRAILVQGDEGSAQVVGLGHQGTPSVRYSDDWCHLLAALPHTISPLEESGFELLVPLTPRKPYAMPSGCKNGKYCHALSRSHARFTEGAEMLPLRDGVQSSVFRFGGGVRRDRISSVTKSDKLPVVLKD